MKQFEKNILTELLQASHNDLIKYLCKDLEFSVEYSGVGYFLTLSSCDFPVDHFVLDRPIIDGELGGISVGFVGYILNSEITLECYTYEDELLERHRELEFFRK